MLGRLKNWFSAPTDQFKEPSARIKKLEKLLGFKIEPEDRGIYLRALRHRSIIDGKKIQAHETYERLEFLGDAVLDLVVTEILFDQYPLANEGFLTKLRAKVVRGKTLAQIARSMQINEVMEIGERASGQGIEVSKSVLADLFESVVAAIYLTKGYEFTSEFTDKLINKHLDLKSLEVKADNFKSSLMEYLQALNEPLPDYRVIDEEGPAHDKTFTVAVYLQGELKAEGKGKNKKDAEQIAAEKALALLLRDET
ncbi:ribonuclease III [Rhodohalobacter sp. SW132]|uniref:ribonuclease III n=1 Tax=Rhodohalobacter sp. SW132 TaxID=2293433 RepID=UPI000E22D3E7|nr:ribonuclease III [Rhodohalobacter sp. SW132]REL33664.1 ribonuclease III [Rhodohalobacter sp. SW132]